MATKSSAVLKKEFLKKKNRRLKLLSRKVDSSDGMKLQREKDFQQGRWLLGLLATIVLGTVVILIILSW